MEPLSYLLVRYDVPGAALWHERLILARSRQPGIHAICSPDRDVYLEDFSGGNPDIAEFRVLAAAGGVVAGIAPRSTYRFAAAPVGAELADLLRQGEASVAIADVGLPAPLPPPVPLPPPIGGPAPPGFVAGGGLGGMGRDPVGHVRDGVGPRRAPPGGCWVLDEPTSDHEVGVVIEVVDQPLRIGTRGLIILNGETVVVKFLQENSEATEYNRARSDFLCCDKRILPARLADDPVKTFAKIVADMEYAAPDVQNPLMGPDAVDWMVKTVATQGSDMIARHHRWRSESGVRSDNPIVWEHQVLCTVLRYAAVYDKLNLKGLRCMELVARRLQLQESAASENPEAPTLEGAKHLLGVQEG